MKNYKLEAGAGSNFTTVAKKAKQFANESGMIVEFEFNGVTCLVNSETNLDWLCRDYSNSWTMEWKAVGPYCVEKYLPEVEAELKEKTMIKEAKEAKEWHERRAKEAREKKEFEEKVKGVELELSGPDGWKKAREVNSDGYGAAALDYAEGWAKLMQIEIAKGKTLAECYDYTQKGLGFLGISGFQFGAAVSTLAAYWKYGPALKIVHNRKYGVRDDAKGTANPAIITIES